MTSDEEQNGATPQERLLSAAPLEPWETWLAINSAQSEAVFFSCEAFVGDRDEHLGMSTLKYHLEGEGLSQFNSGQNVMVMVWVRW